MQAVQVGPCGVLFDTTSLEQLLKSRFSRVLHGPSVSKVKICRLHVYIYIYVYAHMYLHTDIIGVHVQGTCVVLS